MFKKAAIWTATLALVAGAAVAASAQDMKTMKESKGDTPAQEVTVTGEVLDMACYLDHGAQGQDHKACATKCISSGLPVGIKTADGQTYLLIGEHKPMNDELAQYAAQTITVHGKLVTRDGFQMIENAQIVKTGS